MRKPVVQIIHVDDEIPFDVQATRVIKYDHRDLDMAKEAKDLPAEIRKTPATAVVTSRRG